MARIWSTWAKSQVTAASVAGLFGCEASSRLGMSAARVFPPSPCVCFPLAGMGRIINDLQESAVILYQNRPERAIPDILSGALNIIRILLLLVRFIDLFTRRTVNAVFTTAATLVPPKAVAAGACKDPEDHGGEDEAQNGEADGRPRLHRNLEGQFTGHALSRSSAALLHYTGILLQRESQTPRH